MDGLRVAKGRLALGLTQGELAERAEIHRVTMAKIEGGKARVSHEVLERLAQILGLSREHLLGEADEVDEFELARERLANAMSKIAGGFEDFSEAVRVLEERAARAGRLAEAEEAVA